MSIPRIPPIRRFFQLQIPQAFRPAVTSVLASTVGRMNLEGPAVGLTAVAYWARFSRWCSTHPTPGANNGKDGKDRNWLYRSVIEQEALDRCPINYLEFGVYRGDSLRLWLDGISHPDSRFVGFDTFTGLPRDGDQLSQRGTSTRTAQYQISKTRAARLRWDCFKTRCLLSLLVLICQPAWSLIWTLTCSRQRSLS